MNWNEVIAAVINTAAVLVVCQFIKLYKPKITETMGWLLPFFTLLLGPILAKVQSIIAVWLGVPIDLSPIIAAWTGGAAVAVHQIYHQVEKG